MLVQTEPLTTTLFRNVVISQFSESKLRPNYLDTVMTYQTTKSQATRFLTLSGFPGFLILSLRPSYVDAIVISQTS